MRLKQVEEGHGRAQRLMLRKISTVSGHPASDILRTCLYRPELFGRQFLACLEEAMRGPSDWSVGERELFAAFVSGKNRCTFCIEHHVSTASKSLENDQISAALDDWRTAPVNEKVRATLGLLEKLTLTPGEVGSEDVEPVRNEGVSNEAIETAIYVCTLFNIINRIADALGFEIPSPESVSHQADAILKYGYAI